MFNIRPVLIYASLNVIDPRVKNVHFVTVESDTPWPVKKQRDHLSRPSG